VHTWLGVGLVSRDRKVAGSKYSVCVESFVKTKVGTEQMVLWKLYR